MTIGERIKAVREARGLTQIELCRKIGINKQLLYKYENSIITNIPSNRVLALSKALDTTPAYLMGWDEKEPSEEDSTEKLLYNIMKDMSDDELTQLLLYARYLKSQHNQ